MSGKSNGSRPGGRVQQKGKRRLHPWTKLSLFLLLVVVAIGCVWYAWTRGAFLPAWVTWEERSLTANLGEGWSDASCTLGKDHRVRVNGSSESSWTSDDSWLVQDLWSADIDGDGMKELILLVWKQGSFGRHKPFWVKEDERTFSQHIFVIEVRRGEWFPSGCPRSFPWKSSG